MTIITRSRSGNFSIIPNSVSEDDRLSFEARGVLVYLLAKPDNWQVRVDDLRRSGNIGRDKAYKIIKELRDVGYLKVVISRGANGQITGQNYVIYDVVEVKEKTFSSCEESEDLPDTDLPDTDLPDTDLPDEGKQGRIIINKDNNTHLSFSSLRSEKESSVFDKTDILSNAHARKIENLENSRMSENGEPKNKKNEPTGQNENSAWQGQEPQSPSQEQKQQRCSQAAPLAKPETTLERERDQVAPLGRASVAAMAVDGGADLAEMAEKPVRGSTMSVIALDDIGHHSGEENAPAGQNRTKNGHSANGGRKTKYSADFEAAWKAYPTDPIMSKKQAFVQWQKISEEDRLSVARAIPKFVEYCQNNPTYRPVHFCRFISDRRFDGFQPKTGRYAPETGTDKPKSWLLGEPASFSDEQWNKILGIARSNSLWWESWGAMPGQDGCIVPKHLLRRDDGFLWKVDDEMTREAA